MTMSSDPHDAAVRRLLSKPMSASERSRMSKVMSALEVRHREELHETRKSEFSAQRQMTRVTAEAKWAQRAAAANEAKVSYVVEGLRSSLARAERQLAQSHDAELALLERTQAAEGRAAFAERLLGGELRMLEASHDEAGSLLRELYQDSARKSEHLGQLQRQNAQTNALLLAQQQKGAELQKRLASQQRRALRLQESRQAAETAARSVTHERDGLAEAMAATDASRAADAARAERAVARAAALAAEAAQEREASAEALRRCRELHRDEAGELRASLATLQSLFSQLSADQSLVHLRSGGGSTLGEYVRNAHKKLLRRARQEQEATSTSVSRGV